MKKVAIQGIKGCFHEQAVYRFYEKEGLLSPGRNSENGYRDYGEAEVDTLRRIKLLRKLGKGGRAIGFALYLDLLEQLPGQTKGYDVDVLLVYDPAASMQAFPPRR